MQCLPVPTVFWSDCHFRAGFFHPYVLSQDRHIRGSLVSRLEKISVPLPQTSVLSLSILRWLSLPPSPAIYSSLPWPAPGLWGP